MIMCSIVIKSEPYMLAMCLSGDIRVSVRVRRQKKTLGLTGNALVPNTCRRSLFHVHIFQESLFALFNLPKMLLDSLEHVGIELASRHRFDVSANIFWKEKRVPCLHDVLYGLKRVSTISLICTGLHNLWEDEALSILVIWKHAVVAPKPAGQAQVNV
jgi:hypothetical protein